MTTIVVNGEPIAEPFIEIEAKRLETHADFRNIADAAERSRRLRAAAEDAAINRMLMAQAAQRDPRPVPAAETERACEEFRQRNGTHAAYDEGALRNQVEARLRLRRTIDNIRKQAPQPPDETVRATYERFRDTFRRPEMVRAAHIVKHTAEGLDEEAARQGIQQALAELECGVPFPEVADRLSDCGGQGGLIRWFARGAMVQEFEDVVFALPVGIPSSAFRTPLGYHIAIVYERKPAGEMTFAEAEDKVRRTLAAWYEHEALRVATLKMREAADIRRSASEAGG